MTQRSKKASQAVVEEDGKTVDQTIVVSMEIRSPKVEASSEDARAMVVTGSMPLLAPATTAKPLPEYPSPQAWPQMFFVRAL